MAASQKDVQIARDLYAELRGVTSELKGQETEITKSRKAFRAFEDAAQKFKLNQEEISKLNDKELGDLSNKLNTQLAIAASEAKRLVLNTDIGTLLTEEVELLKAQGASQGAINDLVSRNLSVQQDLTDEQKALVSAYFDEYQVVEDINNELENELAIREKANGLLGVSGNILKGLKALGPFAEAFQLDKVADDMAKTADEAARANKSFGKLRVLGTGIKSAFGGLADTLTDPAVIIGGIVKSFGEFTKANKEVRQLTGQTANNFNQFNTSATSAIDQVKTIGSLSKEIGINVNAAFSSDTILAATELTELLGLGAAETAQLSMNAEAFGQDLSSFPKAAESVTKEFALSGKGALNMGDVLKEAGSASGALSLSLKGNPDALVKAAAGAKALGINLQQAEAIADSLLNFQSSIEAEMEAELLTGKQINLEKARMAALNNDMATLTEEIANNTEIQAAFSSGNRIQQDAIAKSLGMSKDQVAKMIVLQKISEGMTAQQAADAADISVEEASRLTAQESITKSIEKMTAAFAPFLEGVTSVLASKGGMIALQTFMAALVAGKAIKGLAGISKSFKGIKGDLADTAKLVGGKRGKALAERLTGQTEKAASATKGGSAKQGKGTKGFLKGLGDGLASIGKQAANVIKGGLALGIVGVILGGSFALAMKMVENVDPVQMIAFSAALAIFGATAAIIGKLGSQVMQGAAALLVMGLALVPAAFAFSLLEGLDTNALIAFSIALPLLSLAAAGLGFIAPFILAGSVAIGALGLALIPLAYGFSQMEGADSVGIVTSLATFAGLAPGLAAVAGSLFAVAGGLGAMAVAGLAALPVMAGLAGLGTVATGIAGVLGLGGKEGGGEAAPANNDTAILAQKLDKMNDTLQAILAKEGTVTLDGTKVGTALTVANSKLQ
jgi:hypothetical protein